MTAATLPSTGRARVVIERVRPEINGGRFPVKRTVGEAVVVEADIFADGHDQLRCLLRHRQAGMERWDEIAMAPLGNDRWRASFHVSSPGRHEYTVIGWVDRFLTWRHDVARRQDPADYFTEFDLDVYKRQRQGRPLRRFQRSAAAYRVACLGPRLRLERCRLDGETTSGQRT